MISIHCFGEFFSVSNITSGFCGSSYGDCNPVRFVISPFFAFLYNPFGSRLMHVSRDALTYTSTKFGISFLASSLVSLYGDMSGMIAVKLFFTNSFAISITRLLCSFLSCGENPRSFDMVFLISSPSRMITGMFFFWRWSLSRIDIVVFPEAGIPVSQIATVCVFSKLQPYLRSLTQEKLVFL